MIHTPSWRMHHRELATRDHPWHTLAGRPLYLCLFDGASSSGAAVNKMSAEKMLLTMAEQSLDDHQWSGDRPTALKWRLMLGERIKVRLGMFDEQTHRIWESWAGLFLHDDGGDGWAMPPLDLLAGEADRDIAEICTIFNSLREADRRYMVMQVYRTWLELHVGSK